MTRNATRRIIGTIAGTAAALALMTAAAAVPARADSKDVAKALVAIGAIALIAKAARDRDRRRQPAPVTPPHRVLLPAACAIEFPSGEGWARVYSQPCLDRHGLWNLPAQCESAVRVQGQTIRVFGEACLSRAGYRPE
jgi:hypothetical protein